MKMLKILVLPVICFALFSCTQESTEEEMVLGDTITGTWFLTAINDTQVSTIECYKDSFVRINSDTISFLIMDRNEDGSCSTVLEESTNLTVIDDFLYIGEDEEAIEIYFEGDEMSWRVDFETTLFFRKN